MIALPLKARKYCQSMHRCSYSGREARLHGGGSVEEKRDKGGGGGGRCSPELQTSPGLQTAGTPHWAS